MSALSVSKSVSNRKAQPYAGYHCATRRILLLPLLTGLVIAASPVQAEVSLRDNWIAPTGPMRVRLAYTDANGKYQDLDLRQLPAALSKALPGGLLALQNSPVLLAQASPKGYFDNLWSNIRDNVCGDIMAEVPKLVNDHDVYGLSCTTAPGGLLQATIASSWEDQYDFTIVGSQLFLDYYIPLNSVTFTVHTNCTCKQGDSLCLSLGGQADPQFTAIFDVHLDVKAMTANSGVIMLPPDQSHTGEILVQDVEWGDRSSEVQSAASSFGSLVSAAAQAALQSGPLDATGIAGLIVSAAEFLDQIGGIAVDLLCNEHLRDDVSAHLSFLGSYTAGVAAFDANRDFTGLYQGLSAAQTVGFTQFGITGGDDGSLIFRVTYPATVAPLLQDDRTVNGGIQNLFQPTLTLNPPAVPAGNSLTVSGVYFKPSYAHALKVDWNKTVWGPPQSTLWFFAYISQLGGFFPIAGFPTNQLTFEMTNLSPGTSYEFQVYECDKITCAPWSNTLQTSTDKSGSDQVTFTLENNTILGGATLGPAGTFTGTAKIGAATKPGLHTITATVGAQKASRQITVCAAVCGPMLEVVDPSTNTPTSTVVVGSSYKVDGFFLPAGKTIAVTFDSLQGTNVGYATVGKDGTLQGSYTIPSVLPGTHTLIASSSGQELAKLSIYVSQKPQ